MGETPLGSCVVRPRDVPAVEMRETPEPLLRGGKRWLQRLLQMPFGVDLLFIEN